MTTRHTIAALSFREGWCRCNCGETVRNDVDVSYRGSHYAAVMVPAGTPEALAGAFQAHRAAVNAGPPMGTLRTEESPVFVARLG